MFNGLGCANCTNCGNGDLLLVMAKMRMATCFLCLGTRFIRPPGQNFLFQLNQQFEDNPALVSISIAGPTASSDEMILPNDTNTCPCHNEAKNPCGDICPAGASAQPQPNGLMPSQMWDELLAMALRPLVHKLKSGVRRGVG